MNHRPAAAALVRAWPDISDRTPSKVHRVAKAVSRPVVAYSVVVLCRANSTVANGSPTPNRRRSTPANTSTQPTYDSRHPNRATSGISTPVIQVAAARIITHRKLV